MTLIDAPTYLCTRLCTCSQPRKLTGDFKNMLVPSYLEAHYPDSDLDDGFMLQGQFRAQKATTSWKSNAQRKATYTFDSPAISCFKGKPIVVKLAIPPLPDNSESLRRSIINGSRSLTIHP